MSRLYSTYPKFYAASCLLSLSTAGTGVGASSGSTTSFKYPHCKQLRYLPNTSSARYRSPRHRGQTLNLITTTHLLTGSIP